MGCSESKTVINYNMDGHVSEGYDPVKTGLEMLYQIGIDKNSQLCVYVGDELVVDLCGSTPGSNPNAPEFTHETPTPVWSSCKAFAAVLMAMLVDRGHLDYN